jgi:hypothetical protein
MSNINFETHHRITVRLTGGIYMFFNKILTLLVIFITGTPIAHATFHSWEINELFSNADGSIQFIEFLEVDGKDDSHLLFSDTAVLTSTDGITTNMMTFSTDLASGTANKFFLIATAAFASTNGAVMPDYIMDDGFLFTAGGTVDFGLGVSEIMHGILPTDGILSLNAILSTGTNSPTNYAGDTGSVAATSAVPVPAAVWLFGSGLIGLFGVTRRKVRV